MAMLLSNSLLSQNPACRYQSRSKSLMVFLSSSIHSYKPQESKNLNVEEREALINVPNAFYFQRILNTDRAALLVRQYLYSSLYDRIR